MGLIGKILIGILVFIILLIVIYFVLVYKLRKINLKIYKYKEEIDLKEKNILLIYQPSRHGTTLKIVNKIKENITSKGYGYQIETLAAKKHNYDSFRYVILIMPVYFGQVNLEFVNIVRNNKIKNLLVVYNGMNETNNEDNFVKKYSLSKYKKIKTHTNDIELLDHFISKEVF